MIQCTRIDLVRVILVQGASARHAKLVTLLDFEEVAGYIQML